MLGGNRGALPVELRRPPTTHPCKKKYRDSATAVLKLPERQEESVGDGPSLTGGLECREFLDLGL